MKRMNTEIDHTIPEIRRRIENLVVDRLGCSESAARKFSLDMTDWHSEMLNLFRVFEDISSIDDTTLADAILQFLIHSPAHIVSAASLYTGERPSEFLRFDSQVEAREQED